MTWAGLKAAPHPSLVEHTKITVGRHSKRTLLCGRHVAVHHLQSSSLLLLAGAFKVNQLPASPFEGARHTSRGGGGTSASNSSGGPASGPFGSRVVTMSHSMDTTNSNSGLQSANQGDHPAAFRGMASSASQKEQDRSPKGEESPFETIRQQQQVTLFVFLFVCIHDAAAGTVQMAYRPWLQSC